MSLYVEVQLNKLIENYGIKDILDEIFEEVKKSHLNEPFQQDVARWCSKNIDEEIMKEAYK
jgi:hypothetical protein